jgi:hypothetical protein
VIGRERVLAELAGLLAMARAGTGSVAVLTGEAGIGKSPVADVLVERARSEGVPVLSGRGRGRGRTDVLAAAPGAGRTESWPGRGSARGGRLRFTRARRRAYQPHRRSTSMITATGTTIAAGTYAIDVARSHIRFSATHSFGLGPVAGTFAVRDGLIRVAADPAECGHRPC